MAQSTMSTMLSLLSVILIALGCYIFSDAFRRGGRIVAAVLLGSLLIGAGFMIFPRDMQDIELPANYRP